MIVIVGCGNANRCDDAAGLEVVRQLARHAELQQRTDVRVLDAGTDGMAVMFAARGCSTLLIVDACHTGAEVAAIFEVPGEAVETGHQHALNLHGFRWDQAIYAGRQIFKDDFPKAVTAYLIEIENLNLGCGLTPKIQAAVDTLVQRIIARVATLPYQAEKAQGGPS